MNPLEQTLSDVLHTEVEVNEEQLERTIAQARRLHQRMPRRRRRSFLSFVLIQARMSGMIMWIWQTGILLVLLLAVRMTCRTMDWITAPRMLPFVLSCCGIAAVTAVIPFVTRAYRYRMQETEQPCYFSGGQLLLARLMFIGMGIVFTLTAMLVLTVHWNHTLSAGSVTVYLLLPALWTACGHLVLLTHTVMEQFQHIGAGWSLLLVLLFWQLFHHGLLLQPGIGCAVLCAVLMTVCALQLRKLLQMA